MNQRNSVEIVRLVTLINKMLDVSKHVKTLIKMRI